MNKTDEEYWEEAMEGLRKYDQEIYDHNKALFKQLRVTRYIADLLDGLDLSDKAEVVEELPSRAKNNNEKIGSFKEIWVEQWAIGDSGDSYNGFIYGKLGDKKYLKIPYSC